MGPVQLNRLVVCVIAGILSGCAQGTPYEEEDGGQAPSVLAESEVGGKLGVQLVAAAVNNRSVSPADETLSEDEALVEEGVQKNSIVVQGNSIVFNEPVILPRIGSGRKVYLAFKSEMGDRTLIDARYKHSINGIGVITESRRLENMTFEKSSRKWVLPLNQLVNHSSVRFGDAQHFIEMDLIYSDGRRAQASVTLRLTSPVPIVTPSFEIPPFARGAFDAHADLGGEGIILAREVYANPSPRRLSLWVKTDGDLKVESDIRVSDHRSFPKRPPEPRVASFRSVGAASVAAVSVYRSIEVPSGLSRSGAFLQDDLLPPFETIGLAPGEWKQIYMGPYQRITLDWVAKARDPRRCALPSATVRKYVWHTDRTVERCFGLPIIGRICKPVVVQIPHSTKVSESASIDGALISGVWKREVRLTDEFLSGREATAEPEDFSAYPEYPILRWQRVQLRKRGEQVSLKAGRNLSGKKLKAYSCQGVFR